MCYLNVRHSSRAEELFARGDEESAEEAEERYQNEDRENDEDEEGQLDDENELEEEEDDDLYIEDEEE